MAPPRICASSGSVRGVAAKGSGLGSRPAPCTFDNAQHALSVKQAAINSFKTDFGSVFMLFFFRCRGVLDAPALATFI